LLLDLSQLLDLIFSLITSHLVHLSDAALLVRGAREVICLVLSQLAHLLQTLIIHFSRVVSFLVLLSQFLLGEVIMVRFQETIKVFPIIGSGVKNLFLMRCDLGNRCSLGEFIFHVLQLDSLTFHLFCVLFLSNVLLLALADRVREIGVLLGNPNLLVKTLVFHLELAYTILHNELLHFDLLHHKPLLELS